MKSFSLLASLALAAHELKVTIALDNEYSLYLPGQAAIVGPKNGDDGIGYGWANVKTHTISLEGEGPWVVGVHGLDYGVISGLFAGVSLDGAPFTATGVESTKFKATIDKPADNWLDPTFDDSTWSTGAALANADCTNDIWDRVSDGQFGPRLSSQMPEQTIKASWLPSCAATNNEVYFRLVIPCPTPAVPEVTITTTEAPVTTSAPEVTSALPVDVSTTAVAETTVHVDVYSAVETTTAVDAYHPAETAAPVETAPVGDAYSAPVETAAPVGDDYSPEDQDVLASSASKIGASIFAIISLALAL